MTSTSATTPASAEITVVCRSHNRKCMPFADAGSPVRIRHMSKIGTPAEFCSAAQFTVRHETLETRDAVFKLMETTPVAGVRDGLW
jgi:hypothetical protein